MKCYPLIVVGDVALSSRWYQELLGLESAHGGDEFEMLMAEGELALCLHHREIHEHPALVVPEGGTAGAGVLLYFSVDDVGPVHKRAVEMGANLLDEPHENPLAAAVEFSLLDPDGSALTVSHSKCGGRKPLGVRVPSPPSSGTRGFGPWLFIEPGVFFMDSSKISNMLSHDRLLGCDSCSRSDWRNVIGLQYGY